MLVMIKYILIFCVGVCFAEAAQLRMKISGKNLPDTDPLTTIDPYVTVTLVGRNGKQILGKTPHVYDNTNPQWSKVFNVDHRPGTKQKLVLELWDKEDGPDEFVGTTTLDLDAYQSKGQRSELSLPKGSLIVKRA
ncbi:unnamed protein product [Allacma fusca]|uniref:C2 domain-containing protein n=1 Tax=Allacma fusca TaxID=39272 RepID=A0A8J2P8F6_9HEXA|nr:unnamed protein product [Allacma fusca]